MGKSIPSVPISLGICQTFVILFGKGGVGWFVQKPHGGTYKVCKYPAPGQQQNRIFQ